MTKAERAAEKVRKAKEKLAEAEQRAREKRAAQRQLVTQAEMVVRLEARKAMTRRRYSVGYLAERRGLFAWSDTDLDAIFAILTRLVPCPNPAAVIDALLGGPNADLAEISLTALYKSESEFSTGAEVKIRNPLTPGQRESEAEGEADDDPLAIAGVCVKT